MTIGGGLGWMKWLKNRAGKGLIFHAIIPALYLFLVKLLLVKVPLYSICLNSIMKKQTVNQNVNGWKDCGICQNFRPLPLQV